MREHWVLICFILGIWLLVSGMMLYYNYKNRKLFLQQVKQSWGKVPDAVYTADQMERLSIYGRQKARREPFFIDEITWKDLDLDRIFQRMNHTVSAPGEEYLLYLLRTPRLKEEQIWERDRLIQFFAQDTEKRAALQVILAQAVKSKRRSIGEELQALKTAEFIGKNKHRLLCAAAGVSLLAILVQPVYGFFLFLAVACVNTADYYAGRDRKVVEIYLKCFQSVLQMLGAAKKVERLAWTEIEQYVSDMRKARKNLQAFQKESRWLSGKNGVSGGLEAIVTDWIRMIFHVDLIHYNKMLGEIQRHQEDAEKLVDSLGELDCAIAAASFREMLPVWCKPSFQKHGGMQAKDLYHPLIENPVSNSFCLDGGMLVTGSNASGKSTFLRNVAVNAVLAQTIATCTASFYQAPPSRILTSMALTDNLEGGESYFMVEIRSLKRILDAAAQDGALLCVVDEVLRGTNTVERIAASSRILQKLYQKQVFCFAATHDIELTYILEDWYENYHFGEEIRGKDVLFSYLLRKGRASSRNAIRLLENLGYDKELVQSAREAAGEFEQTGVWNKISKRKST